MWDSSDSCLRCSHGSRDSVYWRTSFATSPCPCILRIASICDHSDSRARGAECGMDQTTLNNTADSVSASGFGGMPLSIQGRPPEDQGRRVLHAAIDAGITFIDTADVYCLDNDDIGHNERLIASVLRERDDRDHIRIATKGGLRRPKGAWTNDGRPKHIREACEKSLRALETEQVFLYQYHAPDPAVPFEKSVEAFAELQRERKV